MADLERDARALAEMIREAGPGGTVAFTGAGISTESGIPDYRSPGSGLWTKYAPVPFQDYVNRPEARAEAWKRGLATYPTMAAAQPNAAHRALAQWYGGELLRAVITQNVDGLHQKGGIPYEDVIELHGHSHTISCLDCGENRPRAEVEAELAEGNFDPRCEHCGGIIKPDTISFGQSLKPATLWRAEKLMKTARLCLVVGSSLVVYPAAAFPELALESGGQLAIVNQQDTHLDARAHLVAHHQAGELLTLAASLVAGSA
jgi:NAD-dependent deacetylase